MSSDPPLAKTWVSLGQQNQSRLGNQAFPVAFETTKIFETVKKDDHIVYMGSCACSPLLSQLQDLVGGENIRTTVRKHEHIDVDDGWADLVIGQCVLDEFVDAQQSLSEIARILRNGGIVILSGPVPRLNPMKFAERELLPVQEIEIHLSRHGLRLIEKHSFNEEITYELQKLNSGANVPWLDFENTVDYLLIKAVKEPLDQEADSGRVIGTPSRNLAAKRVQSGRSERIERMEIEVEDLCCADCSVSLEKVLSTVPGIKELKVLPTSEKLIVEYDSAKLTPDEIGRRIETLGYRTKDQKNGTGFSSRNLAQIIPFAFVSTVAILVILEIGVERLGLLESSAIPSPVLIAATIVGGFSIFKEAYQGLRSKQITADLLMTVAIAAALSIGQFSAGLLIVFFMSIAHFLEGFTVRKSRQAIDELIRLVPKTARVRRGDGEVEIEVEELRTGDLVIARPGERIPADGVVLKGKSSVDQASITGESIPNEKIGGDTVFAGTINQQGVLEIDVKRIGRDTTLGRIVSLVEEAEASKAPIQKFADRYSSYYLPAVLVASVVTFALTRVPTYAISVLVVSCPCAIALATPLSVVASVGSSAKRGVLVKGGLFLEKLAKVDTLVVDKTGTVTVGKPQVTDVVTFSEVNERELVSLATSAETYSEHPLASAIVEYGKSTGAKIEAPDEFVTEPGKGITCKLRGKRVAIGNIELLDSENVQLDRTTVMEKLRDLEDQGKTVLVIALEGKIQGIIAVADAVRQEVAQTLLELKRLGIKQIILLTGDNERVAAAVARSLGISQFRANLMPEDKIEEIRRLQTQGGNIVMIGDGVNDGPALAQADVGIAMGVSGSDVALEAAPLTLMRDDWAQIPMAIRAARRTVRTIRQNVAFGIIFNVAGVLLATLGILTPIIAAAAQSLPDVVVFLNSSRLLRT